MSQVVDTETAKEFMKETLDKVDPGELAEICGDVGRKSDDFRALLDRDRIAELAVEELESILGRIFSVRRQTRALLDRFGFESLRAWMTDLLCGEGAIEKRFQAFDERLTDVPVNVRRDLASELLHFSQPDRYWLWTRWLWDPKTRTGALPLVTSAAFDLQGDESGEIYLKVGNAIAFVHEVGEAAGFQTISRSIFGTDVFLSCVYVIYTYTVLRMRMTQEFNQVIPGLSEFSRRLLGVHDPDRTGRRADPSTGRGE